MNITTKPESTALTTAADHQAFAAPTPSSTSLMLNADHMRLMMAVAESMAVAVVTVPKHFQGKPGDCLAVVMQATQWNMNPFAVAQKTHVVNGTLGYEAQLVQAVLETTGAIEGTFKYEYKGSLTALECRVGAVCRGENEITWGEWLSITLVTTKNSPLWKTNPKQQMGYLQVKNWARAFKPGAILGVYTTDELAERSPRDMGKADVLEPVIPPELLAASQAAAAKGVQAYQKFWTDVGKDNRTTLASVHDENKNSAVAADKARTVENASKTEAKPEVKPDASKDDAPKATFAGVMDSMIKAKNEDALNIAADWIGEVSDTEQRRELAAKYDELLATMRGAS